MYYCRFCAGSNIKRAKALTKFCGCVRWSKYVQFSMLKDILSLGKIRPLRMVVKKSQHQLIVTEGSEWGCGGGTAGDEGSTEQTFDSNFHLHGKF